MVGVGVVKGRNVLKKWRLSKHLLPRCKFQIIISSKIVVFSFNEHENICLAGLNCRADYATGFRASLTRNSLYIHLQFF